VSPTPENGCRLLALDLLCRAEKTGKSIDILLHGAEAGVADRDRQLLKNIVYGVLRNRDYLDFIADRFCRRQPVARMRIRARNALRIGIYQLLFLSRVPASAAVNETVAAFRSGHPSSRLGGFINAVLRNVSRSISSLPDPGELEEAGREILNHPRWLRKRWEQRYGTEKTRLICRANNSVPRLVLRVRRRAGGPERFRNLLKRRGIVAEEGRYSTVSLVLPGFSGKITSLPGFADGWFQVQDEAAQLISPLLGSLAPGARILDCCAGPGGKTSHLADLLPAGGRVTAVEPHRIRFRLLQENLHRLGLGDRVSCRRTTLAGFGEAAERRYDGILVDAPCSGTGVIGRHPDIRWSRQPRDLLTYQKKQLALLDEAAALQAPGGVLVYATCSMEPEENQEVIRHFLGKHPEYGIGDCRAFLPEAAGELVSEHGFLSTTPADGIDGFFAARLVRYRG